ncbi:hypothetical protein FPZ12_001395 [Amycolatopsis acidicola]|uniref:Uncharacterized protein n=1 Tax=Amycolatopsis acidicola TaxID=2596893 RepID=A0A5N0VL16_9PSEU|nr:hypothetical protein [Amycolatopsis acidicola]KAA9166876.1 hypothetical protein FPZ12_001395 [Amycolatopsis acidicola]
MNAVKKLGKAAAFPLWKRFRWRIEQVTDERFGPRFEQLHRELADLRGELHAVRDELNGLRGHADHRADELDGHFRWHDDELRRLAAHVAAIEPRLATLEKPAGNAKAVPDVDEARAEHARVRARTSAVAQYEERLARVEEALTRNGGGD